MMIYENIEDVTAEEANRNGFEAACNGEDELRNPYPRGTDANLSWNDGYAAYFELQDDIRRKNAQPKEIDPILAKLEKLSSKDLADLIGWPLDMWPGNCFGVASKVIEALNWTNAKAVYGHYLGPISRDCKLFAGTPLVHHGWILTSQGCVIDPTRWVFEAKKPYLAIFRPWEVSGDDLAEYDEGGEQWITKTMSAPPPFVKEERCFSLAGENQHQNLRVFVSSRLSYGGALQLQRKEISLSQVRWLANLPYTSLGDAAGMLYKWIASLGLKGLIPIDFWKRAEREGQFQA